MLNFDQESGPRQAVFETIAAHQERAVLFAYIAAPPMNCLAPKLIRDLVSLIEQAEADDSVRVLVFRSADPDYFISHASPAQARESEPAFTEPGSEQSFSTVLRNLSTSRLITIAQIEGRVSGAGNEFVLACDMRFAAREFAILGQPGSGLGFVSGAEAVMQLTRLMGRSRALEVLMSAEDYDARAAEHYGWVNRSLPASTLGTFVESLAHRISDFPTTGIVAIKECVNAVAFAPVEAFRPNSTRVFDFVRSADPQSRDGAEIELGFRTRETEMNRELTALDTAL